MPHKDINLLPADQVSQTRPNPFLVWFDRIGMYLVFVTYIIVIGGLAFRWYHESQFATVKESIAEKAAIIQENQTFLAEYAELQNDFNILGAQIAVVDSKADILRYIKTSIPTPISLVDLQVDDATVSLTANSEEYGAINQWYRAFEQGMLFSTSTDYMVALEQSKLPDGLRLALSERGYQIGSDAVVTVVKPGEEWLVVDGDTGVRLKHHEDNSLKVYLKDNLFESLSMSSLERNLDDGEQAGLLTFSFNVILQK